MQMNKNVILVGNNNTGKTALIKSLQGYDLDVHSEVTKGINTTRIEIENGKFEIHDFSGEHDYNERQKIVTRIKPTLLLICTDPHREARLHNIIHDWEEHITTNKLTEVIQRSVVVTKCDTSDFKFDVSKFKNEYNIKDFFYTSSKTGQGIEDLRNHVNSQIFSNEEFEEKEYTSVIEVVNDMIHKLCKLIAEDKASLEDLEWRDLERIIAESLSTIGFDIILTPSSKDGGKDIIAEWKMNGSKKQFYIEIKHWNKKSKVGMKYISSFLKVNIKDKTNGGLFISSSGYTNDVLNYVNELSKQKIKLANETKVITLCKKMEQVKSGLWLPSTILPEILFESTI